MALLNRIQIVWPDNVEPEDYLHASLSVIFTDNVVVYHGEPGAEQGLTWISPHLPQPLRFALANPSDPNDCDLFSHHLWNASLQLAEFVEAGSLGVSLADPSGLGQKKKNTESLSIPSLVGREEEGDDRNNDETEVKEVEAPVNLDIFSVRGHRTIEFGAGTALPSIVASLVGASEVVVTDYPSSIILDTLKLNMDTNALACNSPLSPPRAAPVMVQGHEWGDLSSDFALQNKHKFDRVFSCDCLWMPWQHENLRRSIGWFLGTGEGARVFIIAGFHTGREKMRGFFDREALLRDGGSVGDGGDDDGEGRGEKGFGLGLEIERIWERDCDGREREWLWDRKSEDVGFQKKWLVMAVLRRARARTPENAEAKQETYAEKNGGAAAAGN